MEPKSCVRKVQPRGAGSKFVSTYLCSRKAGFGPNGDLCKFHAVMDERTKKLRADSDERYQRALERNESERARRAIETAACSGLTDSQVVEMRKLYDERGSNGDK